MAWNLGHARLTPNAGNRIQHAEMGARFELRVHTSQPNEIPAVP